MVVEIIDHPSTLAALSRVCRDFYKLCIPRLWNHLDVRRVTDLAIMILALVSNPQLARHVKTVAFTCDNESVVAFWVHITGMNRCSPSCFNLLPQKDRRKVLEVWEKRRDIDVTTEGSEWLAVELLPQLLLKQLDADGSSPIERSYALTSDTHWIWAASFNNRLSGPPLGIMRCLSFSGPPCITLGFLTPFALHLYGQPHDWVPYDEFDDEFGDPDTDPVSPLAPFRGIKCICLSIHTWDAFDDKINIFEVCSKYDKIYGGGILNRLVVRMTRNIIVHVLHAFEEFRWPKGRDIVEFRLWEFNVACESPHDATMQEFADGTWYDWLDQPEILGPILSSDDLRDMVVCSALSG
jgi:hypothetical protein